MLLDDGRQCFQPSRELPVRNVDLRSEMTFRKHPDRCDVLGNLLWCILGWDGSNPKLILEIARHRWSLKRARGRNGWKLGTDSDEVVRNWQSGRLPLYLSCQIVVSC